MDWLKIATEVIAILGFVGSATVFVAKFFAEIKKTKEGQKCLLRAEMLKIYYHNKDQKKIRQFELQNFLLMYKAYKAMRGNSFIDEVYEAVTSWEIIT